MAHSERIKRLLIRRGLYTVNGSKSADDREKRFTTLARDAEWAAYSTKAWVRFAATANRYADPEVLRWIARNGPTIINELQTRPDGVPKGTGALEGHLSWLREKLQARAHAFRNQERANRMLALMAAHVWELDDPRAHATAIRGALAPRNGCPATDQRSIRDPREDGSSLMATRYGT